MSDASAGQSDEAALLQRSLDDARSEHARGELDDAGLAAIERLDGQRLAAALARGAVAAPPDPEPRPASPVRAARRRRRPWAAVTALACGLVAVGIVVVAATDPFAPAAARIRLTTADQVKVLLVAAELEVARGHPLRALTAYDAVLRLDPRDPEALVESGWLRYEAALGAHDRAGAAAGEAQLRHAVAVDPNEAAGHLYLGIVLLQHDHDPRGAHAQLVRAASLPESSLEQSLTAEFLVLSGRR